MQTVNEIIKSLTFSGWKLQGRKKIQGLDISIENRKGSIRRGVDKDGHEWKTKMHADYGYCRGTVGKDKDHLDCYIGPNQDSRRVFIVHQNDPTTGRYDEDKCLLGFNTPEEAKALYLKQYDRPGFFGEMDETDIDTFKEHALDKKNHGKKLVILRSKNPELEVGIKVEMEHTDDPEEAKKIALDHIGENPKYYTRLLAAGLVDEKEALEEARRQGLKKSVVWGIRKSDDGKHRLVPKRIIVSTKDGRTYSATRHVNPDKKKVKAVVSAKEMPSSEEQGKLWLKIGEKNKKPEYFKFCSTPTKLEKAGLKAGVPIVVHSDKLDTVMKQEEDGKKGRHGLTASQIMDVQAGVYDPVAIIKTHSETKKNRLIVLTDVLDEKRRPINVIIEPYCTKYKGKDAHMMFSIYGRENLPMFLEACRAHDSFIFKNEKRMKALTGDNKEQFQKSSSGISSLHRDYNYFPGEGKRSVRFVVRILEKSRKNPKLIPQKRMVTRDGRTFQTTVWVLPGQESGPVQGGFDFDDNPINTDIEQAYQKVVKENPFYKKQEREIGDSDAKAIQKEIYNLAMEKHWLGTQQQNAEVKDRIQKIDKEGRELTKKKEQIEDGMSKTLDERLEIAFKQAKPKTKEGFFQALGQQLGGDSELQAEFVKRFGIKADLPGAERKAHILEQISDEFKKQKASHKDRSEAYRQSKADEKKAKTDSAITAIEALALEAESEMQEKIKEKSEIKKDWLPVYISDDDYLAFRELSAEKKAEIAKKAFTDGAFDESFKRVSGFAEDSLVGQHGKKGHKAGWSSIKSTVKWFIENRLDDMARESQTGSVFQKPFAMKYGGAQAMQSARYAASGKGKSMSTSSPLENTGIDLDGEVWSSGSGRVQWDSPIGMITLEKGHYVSDPVKIGFSVSEVGNALIAHAKKYGAI